MSSVKKFSLFFTFIILIMLCLSTVGKGNGFGVDSAGCVYIGSDSQIKVYENGEEIRTIELPPHRSFYFTIQSDDSILFSNYDTVYVLDLDGTIILSKDDFESDVFRALQSQREVSTGTGNKYFYHNVLGFETVRNEEGMIVYHTSGIDYASTVICSLVITALCFPVVVALVKCFEKQRR